MLVDEVAQLDRIELHLQDNRFVGFNADHKQLQVLAAGLRVDVVVLAAAPGEVLDQRPPAGGAGVCHQLVEAAIEFRRVQMLLIENGGFQGLHPAYVRAFDYHSGKGHQEPVIAVHVILRLDQVHNLAEIVGFGAWRQEEKSAKREQ